MSIVDTIRLYSGFQLPFTGKNNYSDSSKKVRAREPGFTLPPRLRFYFNNRPDFDPD